MTRRTRPPVAAFVGVGANVNVGGFSELSQAWILTRAVSFRAASLLRVAVDVGDPSALAGLEPGTSAFAALSPTNRAHEHILPTYLSYSISAGGKNATLTTKRKNTIVALRIPKAEMGITLLIAVAKNAIMVVNDVTLMAFEARSAVYVTRSRMLSWTCGTSALCLKAS